MSDVRAPAATQQEKDAANVRVFPPGVPLGAILVGIGLNRLWPLGFGSLLPAPLRYWLGGAIVAGAVLGLGLPSIIIFRRSGQNENPWKPTPAIVERGPFRFTRNPMYLQLVLVCLGVSVLLVNLWILLLTPLVAWMLHHYAIVPEEAYLERKFGEPYRAYKRRVRRWV